MNPFINDPFAMVWRAFKNLYPEKECQCYFDALDENTNGKGPFGVTAFEEKMIYVFVDVRMNLLDAVEVFAHELAHVAVGDNAGHGEEWEKAFENIHEEYTRIGDEMFGEEEKD